MGDFHLTAGYYLAPAVSPYAARVIVRMLPFLRGSAETNTDQQRVRALRMFLKRAEVCADAEETALTAIENGVIGGLTAGIAGLESRVEPFGKTHIDRQLIVLNLPFVRRCHDDRRGDVELQLGAAVDGVGVDFSFGVGRTKDTRQKTKD